MPTSTMTTRQLSDLEYERKGCLAHEQRLVQEHEESLKCLRDHLLNLDSEIVRLGGKARSNSDGAILDSTTASEADATASLLSLASGGGGYVPSIAPFPNLESNVSRGEKKKRRSSISPRKSEASSGSIGNKGKSKNEREESKAASEKENSPSNSSSSNDDLASSSDGKKKRKKGRSSTSWPSSQNNDATNLANDGNAKQQPRKRQKSNRDDLGEPWTCECGEELPAGRARCGVCKKWKGGKRKTTWKRKDSITGDEANFAGAKKAATSASSKPRAKKKSTAAVPPPKALDVYREVYRKVAEAAPKCVKDAAADILADSMAAENTPRVEGGVVEVMENMVFAVTSVVGLETKPKAKRTRKKKAKNDGMKGEENKSGDASKANGSGGDGVPKKRGRPRKNSEDEATKKKSIGAQEADPSKKRKRGRPKKKSSDSEASASDQQLAGGIQRVVSTSDDEAAPKKRGRPRKNSGAGEEGGIAAEKKMESEIAVESTEKPTQQLVASDDSTAKAEKQTVDELAKSVFDTANVAVSGLFAEENASVEKALIQPTTTGQI